MDWSLCLLRSKSLCSFVRPAFFGGGFGGFFWRLVVNVLTHFGLVSPHFCGGRVILLLTLTLIPSVLLAGNGNIAITAKDGTVTFETGNCGASLFVGSFC